MELIYILGKLCAVWGLTHSSPWCSPYCFRFLVKPTVWEFSSNNVFTKSSPNSVACPSSEEDPSHVYLSTFPIINNSNSCILRICLGNNCKWIKYSQLISSVNNVLSGSTKWKWTFQILFVWNDFQGSMSDWDCWHFCRTSLGIFDSCSKRLVLGQAYIPSKVLASTVIQPLFPHPPDYTHQCCWCLEIPSRQGACSSDFFSSRVPKTRIKNLFSLSTWPQSWYKTDLGQYGWFCQAPNSRYNSSGLAK